MLCSSPTVDPEPSNACSYEILDMLLAYVLDPSFQIAVILERAIVCPLLDYAVSKVGPNLVNPFQLPFVHAVDVEWLCVIAAFFTLLLLLLLQTCCLLSGNDGFNWSDVC